MQAAEGERWVSPLAERYAGAAMQRLFGARYRARLWRRLWLALAECQQQLGLPITDAQLAELRAHLDSCDLERVRQLEAELRHDVMAHLRHFGEQCPGARAIIHLGATSSFVTDNADLIVMREALELLRRGLLRLMRALASLARRERARPCLALTHLQPAQPTTVGKRFALWLQDVWLDYEEITRTAAELPLRGAKGATGTQASFLELFGGEHAKVRRLEQLLAERLGFARVIPLAGQTYPRKLDHRVLAVLAGLAASLGKFATDVRLLQGLGELEEPFGEQQVGSSAMAHKRNPMLSERIGALARLVIQTAPNAAHTAATQWLERSLDDSANRRLAIPECFLASDAMVRYAAVVVEGLRIHSGAIAARLEAELPYLVLEPLIMAAVQAGGDRQELHERARQHAMAARERQRAEGGPPDLLARLAADPAFAPLAGRFAELLDPARHVGRAPEQVEELLAEHIEPLLARDGHLAEPSPAGLPP
ncbi:MAG: adenylosuccinate lyase [Planctomycetota bacterium]|nr:MAG: adenylosuccinate lyase [Planctomycetota bacterium]